MSNMPAAPLPPECAIPAAAFNPLAAPRQPLESTALLCGCRFIEIRHNGEVYRLQATRLGKLILTK